MNHYYSSKLASLGMLERMGTAEFRDILAKLDSEGAAMEQTQNEYSGSMESHLHNFSSLLERMAQQMDKTHTEARKILCSIKSDVPGSLLEPEQYTIPYETVDIHYDSLFPLFSLRIPPLVPYKMSKGANFMHDLVLYNGRQFHANWYEQHGKRIFISPAAVVFVHISRKDAWCNISDYDNLERKRVLDALQTQGLFSDNPSRMVEVNMMAWGEEPCTIIHITRLEKLHIILDRLDFSAYRVKLERAAKGNKNQAT